MSVCVYQADPVAQIEHDDMMVTIMTICSSCSHYTVSVAVLVPCAAAADQHAISFSRHGILVFLSIVLKVRDKFLGAYCFVQSWLTVSCLSLFSVMYKA